MEDKLDSDETRSVELNTTSLIDDHHESVYRYVFRLTGRQSDAEDITQQTYLIAHEKLSYKQIAEQLDVAVGTVMSRLSRAKSKLRDVLVDQGEESGRISG